MSADVFQRVTHNLCGVYQRATSTIAVVPPVLYADQACERAKLHFELSAKPAGNEVKTYQVKDDLMNTMWWQ